MRHGLVGEQALTERQQSSAPPIGQEPERADADKAAGQDMEQETAQELLRIERHHSLLTPVGIILPAKGNPLAFAWWKKHSGVSAMAVLVSAWLVELRSMPSAWKPCRGRDTA